MPQVLLVKHTLRLPETLSHSSYLVLFLTQDDKIQPSLITNICFSDNGRFQDCKTGLVLKPQFLILECKLTLTTCMGYNLRCTRYGRCWGYWGCRRCRRRGTTQGSTSLTTSSASASLSNQPGILSGLGHNGLCHLDCSFLSISPLFSFTLLLLLFHLLCSTLWRHLYNTITRIRISFLS